MRAKAAFSSISSEGPEIVEAVRQAFRQSNREFGDERAAKAKSELKDAIADARAVRKSARLVSVMNLRDKHLAHSLTTTWQEKRGAVQPMKYGDETELLVASIPIIERLFCWVNGKSFSIAKSQEFDQANAAALWNGCKFSVLR